MEDANERKKFDEAISYKLLEELNCKDAKVEEKTKLGKKVVG